MANAKDTIKDKFSYEALEIEYKKYKPSLSVHVQITATKSDTIKLLVYWINKVKEELDNGKC